MLALDLLPAPLVGLILAGVFAATMSTADSLILSCAANLTEDLVPRQHLPVVVVKGATVLVTSLALGIALAGSHSVFDLVIGSWAVMAAAFAPLLTVYALGGRPSERLAIAMLVIGVATVYAWQAVPVLGDYYEGMLAIVAGFAVYGLEWMLERLFDRPSTETPRPRRAGST
jgi:Na+/proline symporter